MRVFLDANVLFSAAAPGSATRQLLEALLARAEGITNRQAWEEARRNLECKRPALLLGLDELADRVRLTGRTVTVPPDLLPDKDTPVLAGAAGAECTHLWTSDQRHFGRYYGKDLLGVRVVSSILLADELLATGWRP
jgi:hypothetical protein